MNFNKWFQILSTCLISKRVSTSHADILTPFICTRSIRTPKESLSVISDQLLEDSLWLTLPCDLLGALEQRVVDVFSAGYLRFDHAEILRVRQGLVLDRLWLGCRGNQIRRVLGAVDALRQAFVCQTLRDRRNTLINRVFQHLYKNRMKRW